jgi:hypothetical protein
MKNIETYLLSFSGNLIPNFSGLLMSLLIVFSCQIPIAGYAQTEAQKQQIISKTDVAALQQFSDSYAATAVQRRQLVEQWAQQNGFPLSGTSEDGQNFVLYDVDFVRGVPIYMSNLNKTSAETMSTDRVHPGGGAGLNLTGNSMLISMWEIGNPCEQHLELTPRVAIGPHEIPIAILSDHATHVAGTMLAAGINPLAKGMAPSANLHYYTAQNLLITLPLEAADGTLLSNWSIGIINTGWGYDQTFGWIWLSDPSFSEFEYFGLYTTESQQYDLVANAAPYHLIVKAAGNDRSTMPSANTVHSHYIGNTLVPGFTDYHAVHGGSGGYDCMGRDALCKNILTVGAVRDILGGYSAPIDVVLAGFSSTGPTDDGRIKPDIVANGWWLFSSSNIPSHACTTLNYQGKSGTSMAAPSVTGSAALLQEHYSNTHGSNFMLAATLKALILHTADEAGTYKGPDYQHGWGLMNTERAAEVITNDGTAFYSIQELTLNDGQTMDISFPLPGPCDNFEFSATIVWNDPAATPLPVSLDNPALMLINDLDLRIIDPVAATHFPWTLDPISPANAAVQTADNFRDNLEQVKLYHAKAGIHNIQLPTKECWQTLKISPSLSQLNQAKTSIHATHRMKWAMNRTISVRCFM